MATGFSSYEEFVSQVFYPTNFPTLKAPVEYESVEITVFGTKDGIKNTFSLDSLYPFQTIYDLQLKIWESADYADAYHPENQALLLPSAYGGYTHLQYIFKDRILSLENPFDMMSGAAGAHKSFVDSAGNQIPIKITDRNQMLLEKTLFEKVKSVYQIHCFLYSDLYAAYAGETPVSAKDWYGKFKVFYPMRQREQEDGTLTPQAESYKDTLQLRWGCRQQLLAHLDEHLQSSPLRIPGETGRGDTLKLSTMRNLRLVWKPVQSMEHKPFRLESFFYDTPVSEDFPYIRFYPKGATPISKIHVEGTLNVPTLDPPTLLLQWAEIPSMTPQEDLVMIKCRLRHKDKTQNPLYATMFIHEDGSAKMILQPNKEEKKLHITGDFQGLAALLTNLTDSFPKLEPKVPGGPRLPCFPPQNIRLEDAYLILELWLDAEDTSLINKKWIRQLLPYYRTFFQVTSPAIKDTNPISSLRYKCVNDFRTPARDFQFLHRVLDLQKLSGETNLTFLKEYYLEEFDVPEIVAEERVKAFLRDETEFEIVNPLVMEYTKSVNYGIDIAIFGKHPHYTFHIYGVDSLTSLQRIKTILSLLITLPKEEFTEIETCLNPLKDEEEEAEAEADEEAVRRTREALEDEEEAATSPAVALAAAEAVAEATGSREEKAAFSEFGAFGAFEGFGEDEEDAPGTVSEAGGAAAAPAAPKPALAALAAEDSPEAGGAAGAGAARSKSKKADEDEEDEEEEEEDDEEGPAIVEASQLKQVSAKLYFGKRLAFYDKALFDWSVGGKEKGKGKKKSYRSMCQANPVKQPTVVSEEEYQRMKDFYREDMKANKDTQRVVFIDYPLKKGQAIPKPLNDKVEVITTLRYGSNLAPGEANIYICSKYWCRTDEMVILADDFEGTVDRKGRPKDPMTCPICRGGLITKENRTKLVRGESVIERIPKPKTKGDKRHLYVRFLGKTLHPSGLYLPCCFLKDKAIYDDKPPFTSIGAAQAKLAPGVPLSGKPGPVGPQPAATVAVDYKRKLQDPKHWYIVGADKYPLEMMREGPQVGILPPAADKFFGQDSYRDLVMNYHTVWKLKSIGGKPNVSGFFRIAVENREPHQYDSFFAAVAPYFGKNSAAEFKALLAQIIQPTLFLQLNYGNFLFDFYNPSHPEPHTLALKLFASRKLFIDSGIGVNKEAVVRAWKAYDAFEDFLDEGKATKEFRMFAQLLSLPGLLYWADETQAEGEQIRAQGVLFIVLELKGGVIQVRCPPYGVSPAVADTADVAFILQYENGIWEPLFYTENNAKEDTSFSFFIFARNAEGSWPPIVKQRVAEYKKMCFSSGLGIYTESWSIDNTTLLPLRDVMTLAGSAGRGVEVHAILRDSYNHISGVLFKVASGVVLVPAVDDGTVYPTTKVELFWKNFVRQLALASDTQTFYRTILEPVLARKAPKIRATYQIKDILRLDKSVPEIGELHALRLMGGLLVPVRKLEEGDVVLESEIREGMVPPMILDSKLVFGEKTPSKTFEIDYKEFREIYQHLRLTFANYLAQNPEVKTQVAAILFKDGLPNKDLPLFEKRQRLFIKLGNEILSWLDSSIPVRGRKQSLKRIDCRLQKAEAGCSNMCVWKGESSECLLHTPETMDFGSSSVDAKGLLVRKLIEELIRFPAKRDEILKQKVSEYISLRQAFRQGNEYIIPEDISAWADLLRMEWTEEQKEKPKYAEEFLMVQPQVAPVGGVVEEAEAPGADALGAPLNFAAGAAGATAAAPAPMPETLVKLLDKKAGSLTYFTHPSNSVIPILEQMGIPLDTLEAAGQVLDAPILLSKEVAEQVATSLRMSVYQIVFEKDNPISYDTIIVPATLEKKTQAPFLFILQLEDESVGVVSSSADAITPVAFTNLPGKLQVEILRYSKKGGVTIPV